MTRRTIGLLICTAAVAGCAVGPSYRAPEQALPATWSGSSGQVRTAIDDREPPAQWWRMFEDPLLDELIGEALHSNLDVHRAALRVAQSRAQRATVAGGRLPTVNASGLVQRQRQSEFGTATRMIDALGAPGNRDDVIDALSEQFNVFQAGFDASWEIDLWGRVRREIAAADARQIAAQEEANDIRLGLIAELGRTYFELRGTQEQLRLATEDAQAAQSMLELMEFRARGGLIADFDVTTQRARLAEARARVPQLQQRESQLMSSVALLLGGAPDALVERLAGSSWSPRVPASISAGIPSELARRRPDIRRAEAGLRAATEEIGIAVADLYPRISLTGSFAQQSLDASDLGEWGARQWVVGPTLTLPIFNGGRQRAVIELRELQQQEAAVGYQRVVLGAWHEIENAIDAYAAEQLRNSELGEALAASRDADALAALRYERGLTSHLVALDARRTMLQAERAYTESQVSLMTRLVALYKALGGGWNSAG